MKAKNNLKESVLLMVFCLFTIGVMGFQSIRKPPKFAVDPVSVIFETDMGNDVDDALALDMLYKYLDEGRIRLLGISNNKNSEYSIPFLQIMNKWYGYPSIPLGNVVDGANSKGDSRDFAQGVFEYQINGKNIFKTNVSDNNKVCESVDFYRRLLSQEADSSVVIISVGFSTNIARLLESKGDDWSPLDGKELVKKKVKLLSMMAGSFNGTLEYNVMKDKLSAKKIFADWPTPIVTSPGELGASILYPASSIENDFKWTSVHPLTIAYKFYKEMPYDRPTWDLTAVLYAVEGNENQYFGVSRKGVISVEDKGLTKFTEAPNGKHQYLTVDAVQVEKVKKRFISLITKKPAKYN